ncbi:MAG: tRNA uridine-5-carboxymethylaminomethyl(34) synthesis GTPase MnmE [Inquilinus sp.]|nr:tRNA uridine-5-carboxymethylaminomethyl(34) synthesis GTPase MnmE [Inquilinus sp.]
MRRTIFAVATPPGRGALAVIRLSGPESGDALSALTGRALPAPRRASLARLHDAAGDVLDSGLVLWFPGPASATGEDVAELHLHGGAAVAASIVEALAALPGLRPAEPGEFTRRAFENGKLDLTEAEAIADLVDAETRGQQRQALRQMAGELGRLTDGWGDRLLRALAHVEADLDFPDEDLPEGIAGEAEAALETLRGEIARHLDDGRRGERLRAGLHVAILGPPNAGKSSLLNTLARRDVAIVSDLAGTTRDVIEVHLDLAGLPVVVADTAGLRAAADAVEEEGVRRAWRRAAEADIRLLLFDAIEGPPDLAGLIDPGDPDCLLVANKIDLLDEPPPAAAGAPLAISVRSGAGVDALLARLGAMVEARLTGGGAPVLTRARHRAALEECLAALDRALAAGPLELVAEDLRLAMRALGRITGRVDVEDLLDVIFRDFCIGK